MNDDFITYLCNLPNLSFLYLDDTRIMIDLDWIDDVPPLSNVKSLELAHFIIGCYEDLGDGSKLIQLLAHIFPALEQLKCHLGPRKLPDEHCFTEEYLKSKFSKLEKIHVLSKDHSKIVMIW